MRPSEDAARGIERILATASPGDRLPNGADLAGRFGVSQVTIVKVMRSFVDEGRVVRVPGRGSFVAGGTAEGPPGTPEGPSWKQLAHALEQAVRGGEIKQGEALPSVKYLSARFAVAPATVIRAFRALREDGVVTKVGKTFWVGRMGELLHPKPTREAWLVLPSRDDTEAVYHSSAFAPAYRKMEDTLALSGYMLRISYLDELEAQSRNWVSTRKYPFGLVLYNHGPDELAKALPSLQRLYERRKAGTGPLVIDWNGTSDPRLPGFALLLARTNLSTARARALARYFIANGHHRAVLHMDYRSFFRGPNVLWGAWDCLRLLAEARHLDPTFELSILVHHAPSGGSTPRVMQRMNPEVASRIVSKYRRSSGDDALSRFRFVSDSRRGFDDAERGGVWVFQSDALAALALQWAHSVRVPVPGTLSMVSLDYDHRYCHLGLTRCEPDWDRIGYTMAHAIVGDMPLHRTTQGFLRVGARVIEKQTTR